MKVIETQDWYLSNFQAFEKNLNGDQGLSIHKVRKVAMNRFIELGFPTTQEEEWKYTSVTNIAKLSFKPVFKYEPDHVTIQNIEPLTFGISDYILLVFVNGHYAEELSYLNPLENSVQGEHPICVGSLATEIKRNPKIVGRYLTRYVRHDENGFTALNTAFVQDGAFVCIPDNVIVETPIHLLFITTDGSLPLLSQPRNLIIVGKNSQATLVENYVGMGPAPTYLTNAVTEVVAHENAVIDHYKLQNESETAFHVGTTCVYQSRQSNFSSNSLSFGSALARNNLTALLDAEGAECTLDGLYLVAGEQHVDNHTTIDHAKSYCTSRELYKGILDGKSRAVFNGKILVRPDAQKTNADQTNKNLLLSDDALIDTKPQLEIFANDVRCTHGATVGQLEEDAIFYLRSRAIGQEEARTILTYAFASDIINRVKLDPVRNHLDQLLLSRFKR
jgi:Fe-S cluster assembly protein SufD